jgi:hypothetical protein
VAWFRTALAQHPFRELSFLLIECLSVTSLRYACCCQLLPFTANYCLRLQFCMQHIPLRVPCVSSSASLNAFPDAFPNAFPSASPLGDACFCLLLLELDFRTWHIHIDAIIQKAGNCQQYGAAGQLQRSYCLRHTCISAGLSR